MSQSLTPKVALLTALYALLLIPFAYLLNWGIELILNHFVLDLFNWFNRQNLILKIILIFLGGSILLYAILGLFRALGSVISFFIFFRLPENQFTLIFSVIIFPTSSGFGIYNLWAVTPHISFWIFFEFIFIALFIFSANTILLPWYVKQKAKAQS